MAARKLIVPIAAVIVLLAMAWLVWWHICGGQTDAAARQAAPVVPVRVSAPGIAAIAPTPRLRLTTAESQLRGTASDACALPALAGAAAAGSDPVAARQALEGAPAKAFAASLHRIDSTLRSNSDPYANAVAIWLNVPRNETDEGGVPESERRRQLAALAVVSTDPRIFAMAFHACRGSPDDGCYALNARRWAALDGGNAMPWLYLLDEAVKTGDVSGQEEALFHMAASRRMEDGTFAPLRTIVGAAGASPGDLMAAYALSEMAIGIGAAQVQPIGTLMQACKPTTPPDANRAQLCTRIADMMFDRSDTPTFRMFGAGMTRRATGDTARTTLVGREIARMADRLGPAGASCDRLRDQIEQWTRLPDRGAPAR